MEVYSQDQRSCPRKAREELGAIQPVGFCYHWFNKESLNPRTIIITEKGFVLALERGGDPSIVYHMDDDLDGIADDSFLIARHPELNHGLALFQGRIYASSHDSVFSWSYVEGQIHESLDLQVVISSISTRNGHSTRTLIFDSNGLLYIPVGSGSNVDSDSYRARLRRFNISSDLPIDFEDGEIYADGLRNEVGLGFDKFDVLWGVENGADNLYREDLGGDIHNDNPAEEMNRFNYSGLNYGYPYCFTEYLLNSSVGLGRGSVWAWPTTMNDNIHSDEWCRNNTIPPVLSMQAHSAPLSITFFTYKEDIDPNCPLDQSFPKEFDGQAFIAFHGSWDRDPPTGYKVVRVPMTNEGLPSVTEPIDLFCFKGPGAKWNNNFKPVDIKFDQCNRMLLSSDGSPGDGIIMITYHPNLIQSNSNKEFFKCGCCKYLTWRDHLPKSVTSLFLIILLPLLGSIIVFIIVYKYITNLLSSKDIKFSPLPNDENSVKDIELTDSNQIISTNSNNNEDESSPNIVI